MAEYINKQILDDIRIPVRHYIRSDHSTAYQQGCEDMLALVKSIPPAANVQAHVKGAWIIYNAPFTGTLCCSVCNRFEAPIVQHRGYGFSYAEQ